MRLVLANLKASMDREPGIEVFLLSLFPDNLDPLLSSTPWLRAVKKTARHHIAAIRIYAAGLSGYWPAIDPCAK